MSELELFFAIMALIGFLGAYLVWRYDHRKPTDKEDH